MSRMTRRRMLQTTGAAGSGIVLASSLGVGPASVQAAPIQVPRRMLGKTGEKIPILVMGGSIDLDPRFDPKLAEGFKYGVNYFDAADCYGNGGTERAIGAFHTRANLRSKIWITSKSDEHDPKGFEQTFRGSLERLQTDQIDMYYLHGLDDPSKLNEELRVVVERLKQEKKMRFFGFSCHGRHVAELLQLAAKTPWIDSIMFRYNFKQYGNSELNQAIDAAHKANIGLIAMKTQGSAVSFEPEWQKFKQTGKWNKFQAVLKAVWADERITAAISEMDNLDRVRENVAAALDRTKLTRAETDELTRYAAATRHLTCDGCDHLCTAALDAGVRIGDVLRYLMYHDVYGRPELARTLFRALPEDARAIAQRDFRAATAACPHGLDIDRFMKRAASVLA
jgi:predicted aldo/keto reductase-like oxidoreductase